VNGSSVRTPHSSANRRPLRIALLSPYSGVNLGDAATQDAIIRGVRRRLPEARFSGITANCQNYAERHGAGAFPLDRRSAASSGGGTSHAGDGGSHDPWRPAAAQAILKRVPVLGKLGAVCRLGQTGWTEGRHAARACRFLRTHDLLVVAGGGQLNDEWGGAARMPATLLKWALVARVVRVPYVLASVGASAGNGRVSAALFATALRMATYRSYRDAQSASIATRWLRTASGDPVVPDLAFSLDPQEGIPPTAAGARGQGRRIVAISPIACARPGGGWSYEDPAVYHRYLREMGRMVTTLLARGDFLVLVTSARSDAAVIPDLLAQVEGPARAQVPHQVWAPAIACWQDLVAHLFAADLVIASRLHSAILAFVCRKPTVAISCDPKVDRVMEDLGQAEYRLAVREFTAEGTLTAVDRLAARGAAIQAEIAEYLGRAQAPLAEQFDRLAALAVSGACRA
jgi:polysaccharide pyruvyl transferase WcaK-like protein